MLHVKYIRSITYPKAVAIPHISLIANVIQMAVHNKVNQNYTDWEKQRFRPGDVALGGGLAFD
jgi:4-coumarate--CoA ligase